MLFKRIDFAITNWKACAIDPVLAKITCFQYYDEIDLEIERFTIECNKYFIYSGNCARYQGLREFLNGLLEVGYL